MRLGLPGGRPVSGGAARGPKSKKNRKGDTHISLVSLRSLGYAIRDESRTSEPRLAEWPVVPKRRPLGIAKFIEARAGQVEEGFELGAGEGSAFASALDFDKLAAAEVDDVQLRGHSPGLRQEE